MPSMIRTNGSRQIPIDHTLMDLAEDGFETWPDQAEHLSPEAKRQVAILWESCAKCLHDQGSELRSNFSLQPSSSMESKRVQQSQRGRSSKAFL
jgi:hypothetical protein